MPDIKIIGAGVAGLAIATEFVDRGATVSLTDTHASPGQHACSWWAGGMLAPYCERESAEEDVLEQGLQAADWWQEKTGTVVRNGSLVLALGRDRAELSRFGRRTRGYRSVTGDGIGQLEPDLAGRFNSGLFFEAEAHLSPRLALGRLVERLAERGTRIETGPVAARTTIDCRGLAARDALSDLRGVKGEMLVLKCPDVSLSRPVRLLHPRIPLYVVPRGDGVFMIGATMIETSERGRITARSLLEMLSTAYALHPAFGEAEVLEIGVDARPAFPDNRPRIRRRKDVIFANGLYRHGFLLAPALACRTADFILEGKHSDWTEEPDHADHA